MNKVVKCNNELCGKYFTHTKEGIKCPFCNVEYVEMTEGKINKKKATVKSPKDSFKMWLD